MNFSEVAVVRPSMRPAVPAVVVTAVISGLLTFWAAAGADPAGTSRLAWCLGAASLLLTAAVGAAAGAQVSGRRLRERHAALSVRADRLTTQTQRSEEEARRAVEEAREAVEEAREARAEAKRSAAQAAAGETRRAAAMTASANVAGRMQALTTSMLADLREMENRHSDEDVLADLLHLDHHIAQTGRLADSIAVLTGARSGRRWARPIVMESILRGAMGRIGGYQRVRLHSTSRAAVAGHAAEGVMHALAELLDNAANFSPPTAEVHVYVEEVPSGVVITIEDSGLAMSDVQLGRAKKAVSAERADLANLSGTRLGLAVVGRLARKHGLTVSFRPSARGGTGVLLMLPQELIARERAGMPLAPVGGGPDAAPAPGADAHEVSAEPEGRRPRERPGTAEDQEAARTAVPVAPAAPEAAAGGVGESGLPKRRRGRTLAAALLRTGEAEHRASQARERERPAAEERTGAPAPRPTRFGAFHRAVRPAAAGTGQAGDGAQAAPPVHAPETAPHDNAQVAGGTSPSADTLNSEGTHR
jgi:signal transduction histidine kinase